VRVTGRAGINAERVNVGLHEGVEGIVHHAMALNTVLAGENISFYNHLEVAAAVLRAGVARVEMALVLNLDMTGLKSGF